jgi:hypothetical protein
MPAFPADIIAGRLSSCPAYPNVQRAQKKMGFIVRGTIVAIRLHDGGWMSG